MIELIRVETDDGLWLDGAWSQPDRPSSGPVEACLLVHGTGSHFYAPGVLETFGQQALAAGLAVLRINTRGHDGMTQIPGRKGSQQGGATWERISDCTLDLAAWLGFLQSREASRVALVGHSMGAVKAILSQAHVADPVVRAIVAISPPRFCHQRLLAPPRGDQFRDDFIRASALVAAGQPDALLPVRQPLPFIATAAGYLEKYGPEDRYDFTKSLPGVRCPLLILLGGNSLETSPAFRGLDETLALVAAEHSNLTCQVIPGANINYAGCAEAPFAHAANWLATLPR